jgi:hypothetical protein
MLSPRRGEEIRLRLSKRGEPARRRQRGTRIGGIRRAMLRHEGTIAEFEDGGGIA